MKRMMEAVVAAVYPLNWGDKDLCCGQNDCGCFYVVNGDVTALQ